MNLYDNEKYFILKKRNRKIRLISYINNKWNQIIYHVIYNINKLILIFFFLLKCNTTDKCFQYITLYKKQKFY